MWECGLKLNRLRSAGRGTRVTPYVGVWIETTNNAKRLKYAMSLLMWECGLKLTTTEALKVNEGHSLCGSVD